jgi:hypothetical protein
VRTLVTTALFVLTLAGCGSKSGEAGNDRSRVERCVDRLLEHARAEDLATSETEAVRRYTRVTYCAPFESHGWVYDDGALSVAAQRWLAGSGSEVCGTAGADEESETVPCGELESPEGPRLIDCAILHVVRRSEVRDYLAQLRADVECDDKTPVEQLGVP